MNEAMLRNMTVDELATHYWLTSPGGMEHRMAEVAVDSQNRIEALEDDNKELSEKNDNLLDQLLDLGM